MNIVSKIYITSGYWLSDELSWQPPFCVCILNILNFFKKICVLLANVSNWMIYQNWFSKKLSLFKHFIKFLRNIYIHSFAVLYFLRIYIDYWYINIIKLIFIIAIIISKRCILINCQKSFFRFFKNVNINQCEK